MPTITVKTFPGENKFQLILRKLKAKSLAHAIQMHGLEEYEGDIWKKLESLAACEVVMHRRRDTMYRILRKLG